jgi:hypothetical protein
MARSIDDLRNDLEDLGFNVIAEPTPSGWTCHVVIETNPPQTIAQATGSTELEAVQAAHLAFWPEGRAASELEVRALLEGVGT